MAKKKVKAKAEVKEETTVDAPIDVKEESTAVNVVSEPVKEVLPILEPHQKYFEAPDGTLIVGEVDKDHVWYRNGNNGQGCWINPKR